MLKLATKINLLIRYTKSTLSLLKIISFNCLLALNFKVFSNSKTLFHLSFTVLLHYQTSKFLDFEGGPPTLNNLIILLYLVKNIIIYFTGL